MMYQQGGHVSVCRGQPREDIELVGLCPFAGGGALTSCLMPGDRWSLEFQPPLL